MRIVIMGAGAIGCLYGGLLSLSKENDVILVGRQRHVNAIQTKGLKIQGVMAEHTVHLKATENASEISETDLVMITTKTYDTAEAARKIQHLVEKGAHVLVLQNGIGTEQIVSEVLNTEKVLRATSCMGVLMTGPGELNVTGRGVTEIGSHFSTNWAMVKTLVKIIREAGFSVRSSKNIKGVVWTKTLVNCGVNPVGALTGMTNGEVYHNKELRGLVVRLVKEAVQVVKALGIKLTTDDPIRYALGTAKATSNNINSMLQDIMARKPTEIDAITGEIMRIARELKIPTPSNEAIYALVKALESRYLTQDERGKRILAIPAEELLKAIPTS